MAQCFYFGLQDVCKYKKHERVNSERPKLASDKPRVGLLYSASNHPFIAAISIDMTIRAVVIDHADGLHKGIEDDGADEFEPAFFEVF